MNRRWNTYRLKHTANNEKITDIMPNTITIRFSQK
nr:MAG TPA: hypothetical protein [Caudoviricetes sp.]